MSTIPAKPTVGWIGVGVMGEPMVQNLLAAGFPVGVWARRPDATAIVAEAGAVVYDRPCTLAAQSDVVILMVSDTPDVEAVLFDESGVVAGARPGTLCIDMGTTDPTATRGLAARLEAAGLVFLDSPVSGGQAGAQAGTLSLMIGGPTTAVERAHPVFEVLGGTRTHVGEAPGAGQTAKACNQILVAQTLAAVGEALILARANGVDPARVREALLGGFAYSKVLESHGQRMLTGDYTPGFKAALHQKDLRIALENAATCGVALPGSALAAQYLNALVAEDTGGALDSAALVTRLEALAGQSIRGDDEAEAG